METRIKTSAYFNGDIIITDPCYLANGDDEKDYKAIEEIEDFGLSSLTFCGDWDCEVINAETNEKLGEFSSDCGFVCVTLLSKILEYNPEYNDYKSFLATLIPNFSGKIFFTLHEDEEDTYLRINGDGIDTKTNKPLKFYNKLKEFN